jgi:hypothetical protein
MAVLLVDDYTLNSRHCEEAALLAADEAISCKSLLPRAKGIASPPPAARNDVPPAIAFIPHFH